MTVVLEQRSSVAALTRQAAILVRGVRPSYGWLAGVAPPAAEVFDDAGVDGWHVGCRLLDRRLAELSEPAREEEALLGRLHDWVRFEIDAEQTRWRHIGPVAALGLGVFQDLGDTDRTEPSALGAWETTLEWCLHRCQRGVMRVAPDDRWLLDAWRSRAEETRGGTAVAALLATLGELVGDGRSTESAAPLLRRQDMPLIRTLLRVD